MIALEFLILEAAIMLVAFVIVSTLARIGR
jgi:hypothetical protein